MYRSTKMTRFAWLLVLGLVTASGCKQAKVTTPPPTVASQDANDSTELPGESTEAGDASVNATDRVLSPSDVGPTTANEKDAVLDPGSENATAESTDADKSTGDPTESPESTESSEVGTLDSETTETLDTPAAERIVLLTPGGPLIVDVIIMIDGKVHLAALEDLIEDAFQAADTDGDGERTWDEVANSPKFMYGQFGNPPFTDDAQKRQMIKLYDVNENGLVDRNELPRFVTRNAGRARSFSLQSSNEFRSDNRSRSPFRRLIDADHNGEITQAEMAAAPALIFDRDSDDNQIITLADIKNDAQESMRGQLSSRRRTSEPDTAILINDRIKWDYASYALQELYAFGGTISVDDWPLTPELFATLDVDDNKRLGRKEVELLATIKPHLRLRAQFGVKDEKDGLRKTSLELEFIDPSIEHLVIAVRRYQKRVSIELSQVEIEFFVNEDPSLSNYEEVAKGQFTNFDTDGNGYLEEDEIPDQLPGLDLPFAGIDDDNDGKVYLEELSKFLELRQRAYRGQVRARAADQEDALFTALDTSGDGRLQTREVNAVPSLLAKMDRNKDGVLKSHEIPGSMAIGFVRGNPAQDNALYVLPIGDVRTEDMPRWFIGMDANQDGEIGALEFLGTADRFALMDKDLDGFISPSELPSELRAPTDTNPEPETAEETTPVAEEATESVTKEATESEAAEESESIAEDETKVEAEEETAIVSEDKTDS
jgi:Ca2+-binding EF-hand superfamily protein